jgi:hypothetical protein
MARQFRPSRKKIMSEKMRSNQKPDFTSLAGYAIPTVFAAIASSCQTQAEGFLGLAVMISILGILSRQGFIHEWWLPPSAPVDPANDLGSDASMHGYALPSLIVIVWFLLIGFGAIR